jgi:leader peptidase (prepilin peptidase)/N-methyltransferase
MRTEEFLPAVTAFLFGGCIGSFLNVCIYRLPREISLAVPRSYCTNCGSFIPWRNNIPLFSWWLLPGKAPCCGARFSMRYFWVELLTAVMFAASVWNFGPAHGVVYAVFFSFMIVAFFTDVDFMIIPDGVNFGAAAYALIASILIPSLQGVDGALASARESALGAIIGSGTLLIIARLGTWILKKEAMGLGDVKLMLAVGAMLGWEGAIFTIGFGAIVGTVIGLATVIFQRKRLGAGVAIPFGPALIIAAGIWLISGREWWDAYFESLEIFNS